MFRQEKEQVHYDQYRGQANQGQTWRPLPNHYPQAVSSQNSGHQPFFSYAPTNNPHLFPVTSAKCAKPVDVFGPSSQQARSSYSGLSSSFISPCSSSESLLALKESLQHHSSTHSEYGSLQKEKRATELGPAEMPYASSRTEPNALPLEEADMFETEAVESSPVRADGRKRSRTAQACEKCRIRKAKCSGGNPCDRCTKRRFSCEFAGPQRQRGPSRLRAILGRPRRHTVSAPSTARAERMFKVAMAEAPDVVQPPTLGLCLSPVSMQSKQSDEDVSDDEDSSASSSADNANHQPTPYRIPGAGHDMQYGLGLWGSSLPADAAMLGGPAPHFSPYFHPEHSHLHGDGFLSTSLPPFHQYSLPPTISLAPYVPLLSPDESLDGMSTTYPQSLSPNPGYEDDYSASDMLFPYSPHMGERAINVAVSSSNSFPWTTSYHPRQDYAGEQLLSDYQVSDSWAGHTTLGP